MALFDLIKLNGLLNFICSHMHEPLKNILPSLILKAPTCLRAAYAAC